MDDAGRYTAEHTLMDANLEVSKLKHLLEVVEDKIRKLEKQLAEIDNVSVINYRVLNKFYGQIHMPKMERAPEIFQAGL